MPRRDARSRRRVLATTTTPSLSSGSRAEFGGEAVDRPAVADALGARPIRRAMNPRPNPSLASGLANCGLSISASVFGFSRHRPCRPRTGTTGNFARSCTVAVHAPGRRLPELERRGRELAAVVRPHHAPPPSASSPPASVRSRSTVMPSGVEHALAGRAARTARPSDFSSTCPTTPMAALEYLVFVARRVHQRDAVQARDRLFQRRRLGRVEVVADRRLAHQPGAVGHQLPQGDRLAHRVRRA